MAESELDLLSRAVESARNLLPSTFALAVNPEADLKARWKAFDQIYQSAEEQLARQGQTIQPAEFSPENLSTAQVETIRERSKRHRVACLLLAQAYGSEKDLHSAIAWQAEVLVPTPPDPDTGRPPLTGQDQVLLFEAVRTLGDLLPEDWATFFAGHDAPVEPRRIAFQRLYTAAAGVWLENSLFPKSLAPLDRQKLVLLSLMSLVPAYQWNSDDLERLYADLLPVSEPDWPALLAQLPP